MSYVLSCCSTADLAKEHFERRSIHYVCFHFTLNDKPYLDDLGVSIPFEDFYKAMADGADTQTSQVNVAEFTEYFEGFLKQGQDILHITLSSGLSGVYNSACIARDELAKAYPERKIYIVDSLGASTGYGLIMETLADMRDEGKSLEELYSWVNANKLRMNHWFFSTDLSFYVKGGRISKAAGWFGTALKICPLLNMNNAGLLIPRFKIRGKQAVIKRIVQQMELCADGGTDYSGKCFISHSGCYEDAAQVAALVEQAFPHLNGKVDINYVGTTIGSHTGPGTVALFFWGAERGE